MINFSEKIEVRHEAIVNNEVIGYVRIIDHKYYDLFVWNGENYAYLPSDNFNLKEYGINKLKQWYLDGNFISSK